MLTNYLTEPRCFTRQVTEDITICHRKHKYTVGSAHSLPSQPTQFSEHVKVTNNLAPLISFIQNTLSAYHPLCLWRTVNKVWHGCSTKNSQRRYLQFIKLTCSRFALSKFYYRSTNHLPAIWWVLWISTRYPTASSIGPLVSEHTGR